MFAYEVGQVVEHARRLDVAGSHGHVGQDLLHLLADHHAVTAVAPETQCHF